MADTLTAHYSWVKPEVGGSGTTWGNKLNTDLDSIDNALWAVQTTANAALPKDGSVAMTGTFTAPVVTSTGAVNGVNAAFSGTLGVTGVATLSGNVTVGGTLGVTGLATFTAIPSCSVAPSSANHLTNKTYVDAADALKLNLTGGTLTGNLSIVSGTTQMRITLGSSGGYFYGEATQAGWATSGGVARVSWNISTGDFTAAGNVTAYSDARLKQNVQTIRDAVALVNRMRGVFYDRIDTGKAGVGVIAQEIQEVIPQVVVLNSDDTLSVAYGNLVGVLIEAVKELSARVEALEGK